MGKMYLQKELLLYNISRENIKKAGGNMKNKARLIFIIILIAFIFPTISFGNNDESYIISNSNSLNTSDVNYENNEKYSENYNNYLNLLEEEKTRYYAIPEEYNLTIDEYNNKNNLKIKENNVLLRTLDNITVENLPSEFDLRDRINIRVENQNSYGTCWAFAALGALRTHLALKGYTDEQGYTLDFSEGHMDYLTSNLYTEKGYTRELHEGGSFADVKKYFRNNDGPIYESTFSYKTTIETTSEELKKLDDMKPVFYVHDLAKFPSIIKKNENGIVKYYNDQNEILETEMLEIRKKIKLHIVENGGLYCIIRANDVFVGNNLGTPYNTYEGRFSQYDDGSIENKDCGAHAVTIIGWDDNYDKNNFTAKNNNGEIVKPTSNGAYLILNSYGEDSFESGYQWVSYEDSRVESDLNGYTNVDQIPNLITYTLKNENAYNALKNAIEEQKIETITDEQNLTIQIYDISVNSLEKLILKNNNLTNEDIEEIFKIPFPNLKSLNLNYNKITSIQPILKNKNLRGLDIDCNSQTRTRYNRDK